MTESTISYVDEWYDYLNDAYKHRMCFQIISGYLEAITDTDYE